MEKTVLPFAKKPCADEALEYLRQVREERHSLPKVFTADVENYVSGPIIKDTQKQVIQEKMVKIARNTYNKVRKKLLRTESTIKFPQTEREWKVYLYNGCRSPIMQENILNQLDQAQIMMLLKYHLAWIKPTSKPNSITERCKVIFCLLCALDPCLTSEEISIIREICFLLKDTLEAKLILSIVYSVFNQYDLFICE